MKKNIDDIMSQNELSESSFRVKLILGYIFKHSCIWFSIFLLIFTVIIFLDSLDNPIGYLIFLVVIGIEGMAMYRLIKFAAKKQGVAFKTYIVKPIVQRKYQSQLYLQDDIPLERLKFSNPMGNVIKYNCVAGNDYFQGIAPNGNRFELTDCTLSYQLLGHTTPVFNGQIVMMQMSKQYIGEPVSLLQGMPFQSTHKDYKNLPLFKTTELKKYFKIIKIKNPVTNGRFFTDENVGFCIPKINDQSSPLEMKQPAWETGNDENQLNLETLLTPEYIIELIQTVKKLRSMRFYVNISIHGDMLSIALANQKDLFDARFLDLFRSTNAITARVEKEFEIIDRLLKLAP